MDTNIKCALILGVAIIIAAFVHSYFDGFNTCMRYASKQNQVLWACAGK